jgi:hypothetical protein
VTCGASGTSAKDLATVGVPVVCSYGARSPDFIVRCTRSLAAFIPLRERIASTNFVQLIADAIASRPVSGVSLRP